MRLEIALADEKRRTRYSPANDWGDFEERGIGAQIPRKANQIQIHQSLNESRRRMARWNAVTGNIKKNYTTKQRSIQKKTCVIRSDCGICITMILNTAD